MIRSMIAGALLLGVIGASGAARADDDKIESVRVLVGVDGAETVTIVALAPSKEKGFLIKFEGVEGDWNGAIVHHTLTAWGQDQDKKDYKTRVDKREYVSVTARDSWGADVYEVYPKRGASARLRLSRRRTEQAAKDALGAAIVKEYRASQPKQRPRK